MPPRILALALLAACDRGQPAPTSQAAPVAPAAAPTPPADPPKPAQEPYTSTNGLVAAPRPPGDGWECVEQTGGGPGNETTLIKCRHTDRARFFFLMAKDYAVPPDQVRTADDLALNVFPNTYKQLFERHTVTSATPVDHAGEPAFELHIEAVHAQLGAIRKRERLLTRGTHVFIVSAEGLPDVFAAESAAIEAWFTGARFKNLAP